MQADVENYDLPHLPSSATTRVYFSTPVKTLGSLTESRVKMQTPYRGHSADHCTTMSPHPESMVVKKKKVAGSIIIIKIFKKLAEIIEDFRSHWNK